MKPAFFRSHGILTKRRKLFQNRTDLVWFAIAMVFCLFLLRTVLTAFPQQSKSSSEQGSVLSQRLSREEMIEDDMPIVNPDPVNMTFVFVFNPETALRDLLNSIELGGVSYDARPDMEQAELELVQAGGGRVSSESWKDPPPWLGYGFQPNTVSTAAKNKFTTKIRQLGRNNKNRWVFSSTSLPLTAEIWMEALKNASGGTISCVIARRLTTQEEVYRAMDVMERNRVSASEFRSVLLHVMLPRIETVCKKAAQTTVYVTNGTSWTIDESIRHREEFDLSREGQHMLYKEALTDDPESAMKNSPVSNIGKTEAIAWPVLVRSDVEAYTSIITASKSLKTMVSSDHPVEGVKGSDGNEQEYMEGAMGLGRSIAFFDSTRERILLATRTSLNDMDAVELAARRGGWSVRLIEPIQDQWFNKCRYRPTRAHQNVRWGLMASKLRTLGMTDKTGLLYMDLDIVVTGRVRRLFNLIPSEYRLVSEGGLQHEYLNAGFLFIRPDRVTSDRILQFYNSNPPPQIFNNLIDCTEMGLINAFFGLPDNLEEKVGKLVLKQRSFEDQAQGRTARLPLISQTLSVGRPDVKRRHMSRLPLAFHFIRKDLCPKPWSIRCQDVSVGALERCNAPDADENCVAWRKFENRCDLAAYVAWCQFRGIATR